MTRKEYHRLVASYDYDKRESIAATIPLNINRAGKHYKKLIKELCQTKK